MTGTRTQVEDQYIISTRSSGDLSAVALSLWKIVAEISAITER